MRGFGGRTAPATGTALLAQTAGSSSTAMVTLSGGDLPTALVKSITIDIHQRVIVPAGEADRFKLRLNAAAGVFSGSFVHPADGKVRTFAGAILQDAAGDAGEGAFAGVSSAGDVLLVPAP